MYEENLKKVSLAILKDVCEKKRVISPDDAVTPLLWVLHCLDDESGGVDCTPLHEALSITHPSTWDNSIANILERPDVAHGVLIVMESWWQPDAGLTREQIIRSIKRVRAYSANGIPMEAIPGLQHAMVAHLHLPNQPRLTWLQKLGAGCVCVGEPEKIDQPFLGLATPEPSISKKNVETDA